MIRLATIEDVNAIMEIIDQAKAALKADGVDQWQDGYPNPTIIMEDINQQVGYVLTDGCGVIGYFMLTNYEANYQQIDGQWLNNDDYLVIHRIAINNRVKQAGKASSIIDYVYNLKANIKIDTHHDNLKMQKMLEKNHFKPCGIITLDSGDKRLAYQKSQVM